MPSYVVSGASRGIGWGFLRQLSSSPSNTVIGLVRSKPATDKRVAEELDGRSNVHILQADITDYTALKEAAAATVQITGGGVDYLIGNAGLVVQELDPIGVLDENPAEFEKTLLDSFKTNCIGNIHLFSTFTPLILKGSVKKVISISTGLAATEFVNKMGIAISPAYTISKAAQNMATAKFSMQYAEHGVLFMNICPGMVDTGHTTDLTEEEQAKIAPMIQAFQQFVGPSFRGPRPVEDAVQDILAVIEKSSVENGDGGSFVSHKGDTEHWVS
ncbi:hypothetical protein ASPVEDRAFT_187035 [Aspergillus versicolor CBS 583.65]|uniref:NAD(P)-binding protein n=1 Tax=Aspergillus versicolor CBS 583.65 TaxID=1036611 RepID=A0A1L9PCA8_ASPVE|nr:uncharacterized protein ASPVEDRAFT_187035 [Aspergillus versicolor CBS 583.65]OJI99084.1 hypothetical protein ASPVEDRAFT_187035 [Aspergillus versicolor CBS 583.65]